MEVIYYSVYILLALLAGSMIVLALGLGLHFEGLVERHLVPMIPILIPLAIGTSSIVSGRNVSFYGLAGAEGLTLADPIGGWILRLTTASIVCASVVVLLSSVMRKNQYGERSGDSLFMAFLAYFASCYIVSGVLGSEPSFVHNNFYALIVFFAAYATRNQDVDRFVRWARNGLNIFIFMGLAVAPILPDIAIQDGYSGIIPGITFRFWGLATHANNLGPISVVFLLLLRWKPYHSRAFNLLSATAALGSLLLSQSKTALIAGIAALIVLLGYHLFDSIRQAKKGKRVTLAQFTWISGPFLLILSLLVIISVGIELGLWTDLLARFGTQASTLTGRDFIWTITLREWHANPLFGYGPRLWGDEFAARQGYLGTVTNAHNQFVDLLGSSGLLGLLCFSAYLLLLLRYAWLSAGSTRGVSLALAVFILMRCLTEVPFKTGNITTPDFLMHFIFFSALLRARYMPRTAEAQTHASKRSRLPRTSFSS
jgi:O-antigen ligase